MMIFGLCFGGQKNKEEAKEEVKKEDNKIDSSKTNNQIAIANKKKELVVHHSQIVR